MEPSLALILRNESNDVSVQIRVQRIENGFLVRAGNPPVFYSTIDDAAKAIGLALVTTKWPS